MTQEPATDRIARTDAFLADDGLDEFFASGAPALRRPWLTATLLVGLLCAILSLM